MGTEGGHDRCEELCEDRECCWFDEDKNCWDDKPSGYCDGYEPCGNLNIKAHDIVEEFCAKDKIKDDDGYSLCESACTTRKCCFTEGPSNCANEFPIWCKEVELCDKNLDMKTIMIVYNDKTEANIVEKACSNVGLLPEGNQEILDCRQVCSERACCFFPGRDNCSDKNKDWCDEFSPCLKLNLFAVDDDNPIDDDNPPVQNLPTVPTANPQVNTLCSEENIKTNTGRYNCENLCKERSCCFLVGFGNCYTSSEKWCDEYNSCKNLFMN